MLTRRFKVLAQMLSSIVSAILIAASPHPANAAPVARQITPPAGAISNPKQCGSTYDYWTGHWKFSANNGPESDLFLRVFNRGLRVSGTYEGPTNGKITGSLDSRCGRVWIGTFEDTSGQNSNTGTFRAVRTADEFKGTFRIDGDRTRYQWEGIKARTAP